MGDGVPRTKQDLWTYCSCKRKLILLMSTYYIPHGKKSILYCPRNSRTNSFFSSHPLCKKEILLSTPFYFRKWRFMGLGLIGISKVGQLVTEL